MGTQNFFFVPHLWQDKKKKNFLYFFTALKYLPSFYFYSQTRLFNYILFKECDGDINFLLMVLVFHELFIRIVFNLFSIILTLHLF